MAKQTRELILEAFISLAKRYPHRTSITMTEIAAEAGISRQAIYKNHFNSTEEIIEEIHKILYSEFSAVLQSYEHSIEPDPFVFLSEHFIPVFYNRRKWIYCLYTTAADPNWIPFLAAVLLEFQNKHIIINHEILQVPKEKVSQLLVKGIMTLLEIWIVQPEPTHPDQFAQTFLSVIHFPISNYVVKAGTPQEQSTTSPL